MVRQTRQKRGDKKRVDNTPPVRKRSELRHTLEEPRHYVVSRLPYLTVNTLSTTYVLHVLSDRI